MKIIIIFGKNRNGCDTYIYENGYGTDSKGSCKDYNSILASIFDGPTT